MTEMTDDERTAFLRCLSGIGGASRPSQTYVEALEEVVRRYGDRYGMSNAPAHLQWAIDSAMSKAALTPSSSPLPIRSKIDL